RRDTACRPSCSPAAASTTGIPSRKPTNWVLPWYLRANVISNIDGYGRECAGWPGLWGCAMECGVLSGYAGKALADVGPERDFRMDSEAERQCAVRRCGRRNR